MTKKTFDINMADLDELEQSAKRRMPGQHNAGKERSLSERPSMGTDLRLNAPPGAPRSLDDIDKRFRDLKSMVRPPSAADRLRRIEFSDADEIDLRKSE